MWWGGTSAPARFFVPLLLPMAIPAAVGWTAIRRRATRVTALAALAFTFFASSVLVIVGDGRLAYNSRESYAVWLQWLNGVADLGLGLPAWWRGRELTLLRDTAIWACSIGAAWGVLHRIETLAWARSRAALCSAAVALYACAAMVATAVVWQLSGATARTTTPGQLDVLRTLGRARRVVAFTLAPIRRVGPAAVPAMLRIEPAPSLAPGGAGPNDRPLFQLPLIPAGRYRLRAGEPGAAGWVMIGIGRDQFSLRSGPLTADPIDVTFPVDVRAIVVRGDEQARRTLGRLVIAPLSLVPVRDRLAVDHALHGVRYGAATLFFMDDRSFPEPAAFWIGGSRTTSVVLHPDAPAAVATLLLRNAPVDNRVLIEAGPWREELQLGPGEEHRVQVPLDTGRGATLIRFTASSGFRPSAGDAASRDDRFLGVWVTLLD